MPSYEYECRRCGVFSLTRPMAEYRDPQACVACGAPSPRAFVSAPAMVTGRAILPARDENGRVRAPRHASGCACCAPAPRRAT